MKYIIGCEIRSKDRKLSHKDCHGIYAHGDILPFIFTKDYSGNISKIKVCVYDNLALAKEKVSELSKSYRRDDVLDINKKSKYIRNFYLLKVNSPKCPIKISKISIGQSVDKGGHFYKIIVK